MSYSFVIRKPTKAEALAAVAEEVAKIAQQQPCHEADKVQIVSAATMFVSLLPEAPGRDVRVAINGYLSGQWKDNSLVELSSATCAVSAALVPKDEG